jgi:hypothetical protein
MLLHRDDDKAEPYPYPPEDGDDGVEFMGMLLVFSAIVLTVVAVAAMFWMSP